MRKYKNIKTNGFDSKKEARRAAELELMQKAGEITNLDYQPMFELVPAQYSESGKLIERPVKYIGDFCYLQNGDLIVEDTKGYRTRDYIIKRKLMRQVYGIEVREI